MNDRIDDTHVHVHIHFEGAPTELLQRISAQVGQILTMDKTLMANMQDLRDAVARNSTVDDSVLALVSGLSQQLKDALASNDPNAIQEVIAQLDANTQRLSDAVTANTSSGSANPNPATPTG